MICQICDKEDNIHGNSKYCRKCQLKVHKMELNLSNVRYTTAVNILKVQAGKNFESVVYKTDGVQVYIEPTRW